MPMLARASIPQHPGQLLGCLKGASLFSVLDDSELIGFSTAAHAKSYKKGKILYVQGDHATSFYVICGGWIELFHTMPEGEEVIIDMLTTGHMVGENAIFEQDCHTSSARVIEDAQMLSMPLALLKEQIRSNPKLAFSMLTSMSRHHRRHYGEMALYAMQNAPQRIGCFLLRLCVGPKNKEITFHLPYDKTQIAHTLGMKSATFSRALNILRKKTGIRISGTRVEISHVEQLIKFVYGPLAAKYTPEDM